MSDLEFLPSGISSEAFLSTEIDQASTEAILYEQLFRTRGIRRAPSFSSPTFFPLDTFELPKESIVHYIPDNDIELGITPSHFFLKKATGMILAEHMSKLATTEGDPIKVPVEANNLIQKYRKANRRIRLIQNYDTALRDARVVCVVNYALLNHLVRYRKTRRTRLHRFHNVTATLVNKMNSLAEITRRHQFIELHVPKVLPSKTMFVRGAITDNPRTLEAFPDDQALMLLELWKWLGPDREKSLLAGLTPDAIKATNIVWNEAGKYTIMNLGLLDSWRKSEGSEGSIDPKQMQLNYVKFLTSVFELKTGSAKSTIEVTVDADGNEEVKAIVDDGAEMEDLIREEEEAKKNGDTDSDEDVVGTQYISRDTPEDEPNPPEDSGPMSLGVVNKADEKLEQGLISVAEHRRFVALSTKYETIPDPYGSGKSLSEATVIDKEVLSNLPEEQFQDSEYVQDKSHLKSTLQTFDKTYINEVMQKDIMSCVTSMVRAGVAISDYKIDKVVDANSGFEIHRVKLVPVTGAPSTLPFTIPVINERGEYMDRGTKYRMRKQRADLPIRKVTSSRVGLTTYYSKLFIDRSERKVDDYGKWLINNLNQQIIAGTIKNVGYGEVHDITLRAPRAFTACSTLFTHFSFKGNTFMWDISEIKKKFGDKTVTSALRDGEMVCGATSDDKPLIMGESGVIYVKGTEQVLGTLEEILPFESTKVPTEIATVNIMGKPIPVGIPLCYYYGFSKLLRKLKVQHRKIRRGSPLELQPDEFTVRFKDQTLIIPRAERLAGLIFGSFNAYKKSIGEYDLAEFDKKDVYSVVLDAEGLSLKYYRELDLLDAMYIDPISEGILRDMEEPTPEDAKADGPIYFPRLLLRAVELLLTDDHPDENDSKYRRIRGYERIAGHLYSQIVVALRMHKAGENNPKSTVDMNPHAVMSKINQDPAVTLVDEINPIQNLKELENLTYGGTGGRSGRTMVRQTRAFHKSELGLISESTVDSQDVGVTTFMPPNPKLKSLRGLVADWEFDEGESASFLSTSSLVSPNADGDDPKRMNFIAIQQSHVVAAHGYVTSPLLTGYEDIIAQRSGPLFSAIAEGEGKVTEVVDDSHITVTYKNQDLPVSVYQLGTQYGVSGKYRIPHKVITDLSVGAKVNKGDVIAFNSGFFSRSLLQPTQVTWKTGALTRIALMETPDTLEDSIAISPELGGQLVTTEAVQRDITVRFDQVVRNLVNEGDSVESDSILCNIEDAATSQSDLFDQEVMDSLKMIAQSSPTSKKDGKVKKIEIIYHGDLDDMNESLRTIVLKADRSRAKRAKLLGSEITSGEVADLDMDTVVIKVFIEGDHGMGDGDKIVVSNQLKCTVSRVMVGENHGSDGKRLGGIFGGNSVSDRIVTSFEKTGTTISLIIENNLRAAAAYRKHSK